MPAFLTHYACGIAGYHHMQDGSLKEAVRAHTGVYGTALAGPDLFFYSIFESIRPGMTIGRIMHKFRTGAFLRKLYANVLALEGEERETGLAWLAGFIGHYCLDSACHALVFRVSDDPSPGKALGKHFRYEAAMDAFTCECVLGRPVRDAHQMGLIRMNAKEIHVISSLMAKTIKQVYPDAHVPMSTARMEVIFREYVLITGLIIDPDGFREWLVLHAEQPVLGYPLLSPLCINDHRYGLTKEDYRRFMVRFKRGLALYDAILPRLQDSLDDPENVSKRETFYRILGSRSYHGMDQADACSREPLDKLIARTGRRDREKRAADKKQKH